MSYIEERNDKTIKKKKLIECRRVSNDCWVIQGFLPVTVIRMLLVIIYIDIEHTMYHRNIYSN